MRDGAKPPTNSINAITPARNETIRKNERRPALPSAYRQAAIRSVANTVVANGRYPHPSTVPGKSGKVAGAMLQTVFSASYAILIPPLNALIAAKATTSAITHISGSDRKPRSTLRRESRTRSPPITEGERNIHTATKPDSHKITVATQSSPTKRDKYNGATAAMARCAANAYLAISFCT